MMTFISFAKMIRTNKETHVMTYKPTACRKQSTPGDLFHVKLRGNSNGKTKEGYFPELA